MKQFKRLLLLLAAMLLTTVVSAQNLLGDMNHNGSIDVGDITLLIDDYLSGESEEIPYTINNSLIVGRWYLTADDYLTFYEDGTSDAFGDARYTFYVMDDYGILFFHRYGVPMLIFEVPTFTDNYLVIENTATEESFELTRALIELSEEELTLTEGYQAQLTASVIPEDAGTVYWKSNTPGVARVSSDGLVTAVAKGTAIITAEVAGVQATCLVTVNAKTYHYGYEYVDLGLNVKWATMNVGANAPEDYGDYFAWGETTPKSYYDWSTYKWCNGSYNTMTKYHPMVDNKTTLDLSDDAARQNWGGTWRMPTIKELQELNLCYWESTTINGVSGWKVTSKTTGQYIFLPAAGYYYQYSNQGIGFKKGYYWSSEIREGNQHCGQTIEFDDKQPRIDNRYEDRRFGIPVRAVCP